MKKEFQLILLVIVFSISAGMRLAISGWLFFIGLFTIFGLGFFHFYTHIKSIDSLTKKGNFNILKIFFSHITFSLILILQTDGGDSNSYSGISYAFDLSDSFINQNSNWIFIGLIILYFAINLFILGNPRIQKMTDDTRRFLPLTIISSIILTFFAINGIEELREYIVNKKNKETRIDYRLIKNTMPNNSYNSLLKAN